MTTQPPYVKNHQDGWILYVKVTPNSRQNLIGKPVKDAKGEWYLTVKVTVPPEEGKANLAVINLLSRFLGLPKTCIVLKKGSTSSYKAFSVTSLSAVWIDRFSKINS